MYKIERRFAYNKEGGWLSQAVPNTVFPKKVKVRHGQCANRAFLLEVENDALIAGRVGYPVVPSEHGEHTYAKARKKKLEQS